MNHVAPFAMLAPLGNSHLRVSNFPPEAVDWIIEAASTGWPRVSATRASQHEIVFSAPVWSPTGAETIYARRLMLHVLRRLQAHGFFLLQGLDLTGNKVGKDVLLFERRDPSTAPMMAISVNGSNLLRLISAPDDIVAVTKACLDYHFTPQHVTLSPKIVQGTTQFELDGHPWQDENMSRSTHGRLMIAHLFAQLQACGWRLAGAIKQTGDLTYDPAVFSRTDYTNATKDSFFFTFSEKP